MRNWWIRFGCFLTGYNYSIVDMSSEVAAKSVKRYTSALVIVCIVWAFVGYTFTQRYLQSSILGSIAGAITAIVIIIQIERQIILSISPNLGVYVFRGCLALMMAVIGAVIIDQIILKQDIELEKIGYVGEKVDKLLPSKTAELKNQIFTLDTTIQQKEQEKLDLIDDVSKRPLIKSVASQTQSIPIPTKQKNSQGNDTTIVIMKLSNTVQVSNIPNPKQSLILPMDIVIAEMRKQKILKENLLLNIRPDLETQISSKVGFLDELKIMYRLISNSSVALGFWLLWFLFLLFIEMLVLFSKVGDKGNDYEKTVLHQMNLQIKKLDILAKRVQES